MNRVKYEEVYPYDLRHWRVMLAQMHYIYIYIYIYIYKSLKVCGVLMKSIATSQVFLLVTAKA